jgi:hypothetical protein
MVKLKFTRRQQRRGCVGKQKHASKSEAIRVWNIMKKKYPGERFSYYKCQRCGGWHVGHTANRVRQSLRDKYKAGKHIQGGS